MKPHLETAWLTIREVISEVSGRKDSNWDKDHPGHNHQSSMDFYQEEARLFGEASSSWSGLSRFRRCSIDNRG